jgi:hypothetical protein
MLNLRAAAALFAGPAAWALHQQGGYMLVPEDCRNHAATIPVLTVAALAIIAGGAWISWRVRGLVADAATPSARAQRFLVHIGLLAEALFALAVVLQFGATLILGGCQRW